MLITGSNGAPATTIGEQLLSCVPQPATFPLATTVGSPAFLQDGLTDAQTLAAECGGGASRKRGRPRKPKEDDPTPKRPRGRPRKFKELVIGPKKPRGRPRKHGVPPIVSTGTRKAVSNLV